MTTPDAEATDVEAERQPPQEQRQPEHADPPTFAATTGTVRGHGPLVAWLPYLLIIGPAAAWAMALSGFVFGVVSRGVAASANVWEGHVVAATTAVACICWFYEVWRRRRAGEVLTRIPRLPLAAFTIVACGYCLVIVADSPRLDGGSLLGQYIQAGVVLLWCPLLIPALGEIFATRPDGSHAAARRSAVLSMAGLVLAGVALTSSQVLLAYHGSLDMLYRQYELNTDPAFQGTPIPSAVGLGGVLAACAYCVSNAILEEFVFAVLVLGLDRARWNKSWIIAVAFVLRAAMYMYYGPSGAAGGIFGAANASVLLRTRRLVPIIAMHALFDAIIAIGSDNNLFPSGWVALLGAEALVCAAAVAVLIAVDKLVRGSADHPRSLSSAVRRVWAR